MDTLPLLLFTLRNPEWLIILVIVVILFGGSRLGQLGGALGQSIREFRRASRDEDDPAPPTSAAASPASDLPQTPVTPAASPPPSSAPRPGDFRPSSAPASADRVATARLTDIVPRPSRDGVGADRTPEGS